MGFASSFRHAITRTMTGIGPNRFVPRRRDRAVTAWKPAEPTQALKAATHATLKTWGPILRC